MKCASENNTVTYYPNALFQTHSTGITRKHGLNWKKFYFSLGSCSVDTNLGGRMFYTQ
jgi:hypothetical protein